MAAIETAGVGEYDGNEFGGEKPSSTHTGRMQTSCSQRWSLTCEGSTPGRRPVCCGTVGRRTRTSENDVSRCRTSTGDVQDREDLAVLDRTEQSARLCRRQGDQLHPPKLCLLPHLGHDRESSTRSGSHHESRHRPGDVLVDRQRRMPIPVTVSLGWSFLPAADPTRFHHHVVLEATPGDHDGAETRIVNVHRSTIRPEGTAGQIISISDGNAQDLMCPRVGGSASPR